MGNFGRKPHYYAVNKNRVDVGTIVSGRSCTARVQKGKKREAQQLPSATEGVKSAENFRVTQNMPHLVAKHNAMASNFFEKERLNYMLNKTVSMMDSRLLHIANVHVRRLMNRNKNHLIDMIFSNALAQHMSPPLYSSFLQTMIPQHQL